MILYIMNYWINIKDKELTFDFGITKDEINSIKNVNYNPTFFICKNNQSRLHNPRDLQVNPLYYNFHAR